MTITYRPHLKIGLALGSGSSRGWAHIGIIEALTARGLQPDIVCGTSVGALVAAAHTAGNLNGFKNWITSLTRLELARFFELTTSPGFVNTKRLRSFLHKHVVPDGSLIENFHTRFGCVATELQSGREVWFTKGPMLHAVWASMSLPGLFPAIRHENRWLVDGGLVNPVPVSVCRALGADIVIAVNLNGDIVGKHFNQPAASSVTEKHSVTDSLAHLVREYASSFLPFIDTEDTDEAPGLFDAIAGSVNIAQERITRSRLAGDPPDILLSPKLAHIALLEFHRAEEAMEEGRKCVERMLPEILHVLHTA